jgi:thymidylate synthase ThyX
MYKAEILAVTMKITFPRFILAEFNTHRMFSRNSASSRAIPFKKMVQMVEENPFIPIAWQKDHKGMQGNDYLTDEKIIDFKKGVWLNARNKAVESAKELFYNVSRHTSLNDIQELEGTSVTKQLCNRLLEPFMWHTVIVTSGKEGLENFFKLRCPQYKPPFDIVNSDGYKSWKDVCEEHDNVVGIKKFSILNKLSYNESQADIHIQAIAELMWDAYNESTPKQLQAGEWHIPFGDNIDSEKLKDLIVNSSYVGHIDEVIADQFKISVATARCARISYETLGDNPKIDYEADLRLHDMLAKSGHWSPFEHVARVMGDEEYKYFVNGDTANMNWDTITGWCRNFRGFIQYRRLIEHN